MIILVEPEVEILDSSDYMRSMTFAGRITHGCEDKYISHEDDVAYVERMKPLGHGRVFEFGTIYLTIDEHSLTGIKDVPFFLVNRYSKVRQERKDNGHLAYHITTNYRVLLQGRSKDWKTAIRTNYKDNMLYLLNDDTVKNGRTEHHIPRVMVYWKNISRVTADSFRTHTMLSSLMQSTRYCNYSRNRFGGCVKITPSIMWDNLWRFAIDSFNTKMSDSAIKHLPVDEVCRKYLYAVNKAASTYIGLTIGKYNGVKIPPECARGALPLDTSTMFVQCGFVEDWDDFFRQRVNEQGAHPDAQYIVGKLKNIFPEEVE